MKKPLLASLGLIGACAACCAIPLAIPLASGLSVAGLASIDWNTLAIGGDVAAVASGLATAGLVGGAIWWHRRRNAAARCAPIAPTEEAAPRCATACGCREAAP